MRLRIVELELCSKPRDPRTPFDGKEIAINCRSDTGLSDQIVLGLSLVADVIDVQNLKSAFACGELSEEEFTFYSNARGLKSDKENQHSACQYLAFAEGQSLAWLHIPAEQTGLGIAKKLVLWAAQNGMEIRKGSSPFQLLSEEEIYEQWQSERSDI
jgi:hypothetical protein